LAPPKGFHDRLHQRLDETLNLGPKERIHTSRRAVLAWGLAAAAAASLGFAIFSAKRTIWPRLEHQNRPGSPDSPAVTGLVAVSQDTDDKVYHVAGCSHLQGKPKFLPVEEAIREGYTSCVYCIGKARPKQKS